MQCGHYATKDDYVIFAENLKLKAFSMELPSANTVQSLLTL